MDLDDVDFILQLVLLADGLGRELALLADGHEAAAQAIGDGAAEDKSARLDAGNRLDPPVGEGRDQPLDAGAQAVGMTEQRGDVAEHDAGLRIVGYRAHEVLEIDVFGQAHARISMLGFEPGAGFSAYSGTKRGWLARRRQNHKGNAMTNGAANLVTIRDIDVPFWRIVMIMIKWSIAAIPATIILVAIWVLVGGLFAALFGPHMPMNAPKDQAP